jgi:uncharacterized protein (TIGR03000 family)
MYGVILMAALSTAPTTQGFCFRGGCNGGCHSSRFACHGCNGCNGGRCHGGYGGCHGGGYNGGSYYGGGCYGCHSWSNGAHGYGCYGCYSYGGFYGAYGCHGGCYGTACHGFLQAYGGLNGYGMPYANVEPAPPSDPARPGKIEQVPPPREKQKTEEARARIIIEVPADAKLWIDGQLMQANSAKRTYQTPDLQPGSTYFYDLKAEVIRDGQAVTQSQRIVLRPGRESFASFANLGQATPSATAKATE